jgi:hypothetical protein
MPVRQYDAASMMPEYGTRYDMMLDLGAGRYYDASTGMMRSASTGDTDMMPVLRYDCQLPSMMPPVPV